MLYYFVVVGQGLFPKGSKIYPFWVSYGRKLVVEVSMFLQDCPLIPVPKDVMVIRAFAFINRYEFRGYSVFFQGFQANFAVSVGSD